MRDLVCFVFVHATESRQVNVGKFFIVIRDNRKAKITGRNLLLRLT